MNIVVTHSNNYDFVNELYIPIKNDNTLKVHNIHLPEESRAIDTKELIKNCDLVIAEVSYPSTGQGIELGWANYVNKPIYCIYKKDKKFSSALKFITSKFYSYSDERELIDILNLIVGCNNNL